jgi:hypothetical protein
MTLGRVEEVLDEVQEEATRDFTPETFRYIRETLNRVRVALGLDPRLEEDRDDS